jgi:hypothetical protein
MLDLTGRRFERLLVVKETERKSKYRRYWLCKCDCGNEVSVSQTHLISGHAKSCSCLRIERTSVPDSGFRGLLQRYQAAARTRGLSWELTEEQFRELTQSACYYTGRKPSQTSRSANSNLRRRKHGWEPTPGGTYVYNGIDRLDSEVGYTPENCVPCCGEANLAKQSLGRDDFVRLCNEVAQHHQV